jgi:hypothetical protein
MVNQSATALLVRTIATVNEVIAGTGTGKETGIAEGETATTATVTPTAVTAKGIAIATGTVNVAAIGRKDARATRKNADESRVKTTADDLTATKRAAPRAVRAAAAVVSVTEVRQIAARPHQWAPSRSHSANVRQAVGTSMLRATSNIRLCRRNKPVRTALAKT